MYYVRCNTRSSGASAKGTPAQALRVHHRRPRQRARSFLLARRAALHRAPGSWLEARPRRRARAAGGLGALHGCVDQAELAREFVEACQPYHDRRGTTGYLSYTFTMPKELSLVAEGHPVEARRGHVRGPAEDARRRLPRQGVQGRHGHSRAQRGGRGPLPRPRSHRKVRAGSARERGRFRSTAQRREHRASARVGAAQAGLEGGPRRRAEGAAGLTVTQGAPFARPALTLADGTYVPALNRESRRVLDKHLCFRLSDGDSVGGRHVQELPLDALRPDHLRAGRGEGPGVERGCLRELFPKLAPRLKTYESRVATLKRIGYLTDGRHGSPRRSPCTTAPTGATIRSCRRLRADLHKLTKAEKKAGGTPGGGGAPPPAPARSRRRDGRTVVGAAPAPAFGRATRAARHLAV